MPLAFTWISVRSFVIPAAIIVGAAAAGAMLEFIVQRKISTISFVRQYPWLSIALDSLDAGVMFWVTSFGVYIAITTSLAPPPVIRLLNQALLVLVCASVTIMAARFAGSAVLRISRGPGQQIASGTLFASVSRALVVVMGLLVMLSSLGIEITPLLTALGVGGLAVALALQPPLANLFSGLQLIASRQIRPGDYVALQNGKEGFVEDINWRCISIRESTNNLVVVPNQLLAQEIFVNYRLPEPRVCVRVPIRVAYGSDLDFVERLALEAVESLEADIGEADATREAFVCVHEFADVTINLSVNFFVRRAIDQERARSVFLRRFYELMNRNELGSPVGNPVVPRAITGKV